ncbi:MAG: MerR family DNA-binding transcriptional regulator [Rhizobiales bacterium]|nr:MerR family DNA-binding transcriptional regulator [Hyphomicrobiales bacterium]
MTATKIETVRYYERIGLLTAPERTAANYRLYGTNDLNRQAVDAIAKEHLDEVNRKISDLQALRRELDGMLRRCRSGTVAECRIIEALSP